jgi:hypothetical protein
LTVLCGDNENWRIELGVFRAYNEVDRFEPTSQSYVQSCIATPDRNLSTCYKQSHEIFKTPFVVTADKMARRSFGHGSSILTVMTVTSGLVALGCAFHNQFRILDLILPALEREKS